MRARKLEIIGKNGQRVGIKNIGLLLKDPAFISLRNLANEIAMRMTKLPGFNNSFWKPDII